MKKLYTVDKKEAKTDKLTVSLDTSNGAPIITSST